MEFLWEKKTVFLRETARRVCQGRELAVSLARIRQEMWHLDPVPRSWDWVRIWPVSEHLARLNCPPINHLEVNTYTPDGGDDGGKQDWRKPSRQTWQLKYYHVGCFRTHSYHVNSFGTNVQFTTVACNAWHPRTFMYHIPGPKECKIWKSLLYTAITFEPFIQ